MMLLKTTDQYNIADKSVVKGLLFPLPLCLCCGNFQFQEATPNLTLLMFYQQPLPKISHFPNAMSPLSGSHQTTDVSQGLNSYTPVKLSRLFDNLNPDFFRLYNVYFHLSAVIL